MSFLTAARRLFRRDQVPTAPKGTGAPAVRNSASYEAGSTGTRRVLGWPTFSTRANDALLSNLTTLRDRSRAAVRNDGYGKGAINRLVSNLIGTGIRPIAQADDPEFRRRLQALWERWTDESDADGLLDFYGQQAQAARTWLTGGESFTRLRPRLLTDGLSVPLQIQILEPELCPHDYTHWSQRIRAGIEFDGIGRRVAYHFHPCRPEHDDYDASRYVRLPADLVVHLYNPLRPGQLRGEPQLAQALVTLHETHKFADAALLRQQLANLLTGFVRKPATLSEPDEVDPLTGLARKTIGGKPFAALEPGTMQELEPGEELEWSDPPEAPGYGEFMRAQLRHIATAADVPYELLTGDLSDVNDRSVRVLLHEFRRAIQAWQHQIIVFQFCRRVWRAWMDRVFLSQALPIPMDYLTDPEPYARVLWQPQGWPYINPLQDVQANKEAVRSGFRSRTAVVSEQGDDAEVIDAQQAADNERADALKLAYDSDGRRAAKASAAPAPEPEPEPEPGREPAPAE